MTDNQNPISPHLQVYRWHISSLLSIAHRILGVINLLSLISIFSFLLILSFGENYYDIFLTFIKNSLVNGPLTEQIFKLVYLCPFSILLGVRTPEPKINVLFLALCI